MKLNIISLPHRKDRYDLVMNEIERQGIESYQIWPGIQNPKNSINENIAAAHKQIVMDAKRNNLPYVIIAEDDVHFPAKDGWKYFLSNMPQSYDLYLGGVYRGIDNILGGFSGMHLYAVAQSFYDQYLLASAPDGIDNAMSRMIRHGLCKANLCYPIAAIQHETPSDNYMLTNMNKYFFNKHNTYGY